MVHDVEFDARLVETDQYRDFIPVLLLIGVADSISDALHGAELNLVRQHLVDADVSANLLDYQGYQENLVQIAFETEA